MKNTLFSECSEKRAFVMLGILIGLGLVFDLKKAIDPIE